MASEPLPLNEVAAPARTGSTVWTLLLLALAVTSGAAVQGALSPLAEVTKADMGLTDLQLSYLQGLAVAIPAVFGYNIFASKLNGIDGELEGFGSELIALLVREGRI